MLHFFCPLDEFPICHFISMLFKHVFFHLSSHYASSLFLFTLSLLTLSLFTLSLLTLSLLTTSLHTIPSHTISVHIIPPHTISLTIPPHYLSSQYPSSHYPSTFVWSSSSITTFSFLCSRLETCTELVIINVNCQSIYTKTPFEPWLTGQNIVFRLRDNYIILIISIPITAYQFHRKKHSNKLSNIIISSISGSPEQWWHLPRVGWCVLRWLSSQIIDLQILVQLGQEVPDGSEPCC